jgi:adhesin transport system outer membrane protein
VGEQVALLGQAEDLRDKTCRDVAQTAAIAYNDVARLAVQLRHLRLNAEAIERARLAYRQQFDIGQRSLLDLLNAENEGYTAQRALAMAEFDHALALIRSHASGGQLAVRFGLRPPEVESPAADWRQGDDRPARCPLQPLNEEVLP